MLAALAVDVDDTELNCCGYPVRHNDFTAAMLCGTRVLAMAARKGLPLLTPANAAMATRNRPTTGCATTPPCVTKSIPCWATRG
ncbi:MAG: hypothetical protein MZV70_29375 [Desulfobacterales bacterium]|nr:hypothetical protein [Desulfobacterales bacterium]